MTTKAPARPRLSGWCNPTLPRTEAYDPHQRCQGCDCRATACPCNPDTQEPTMPVHIDPAVQQQAAAGVLTPRSDGVTTSDTLPEEVVLMLQGMANQLNAALKGYAPEDWRDAVRLLHRLRTAVSTLRDLDASLVQWAYLNAEHGDQDIEGLGRVKITRTRDRRDWDDRGVVGAIIDQHMADRSGEVPADPWVIAEWVLEAAGISYWRTTQLKALGLEPRAFCEETPGKPQVTLPPVKGA